MSDHEPVTEEMLSAYLDGELSPTETKLVEQRLESDPLFRTTFDELQTLRTELQALPRMSLSADFAQSITDQIQANSHETVTHGAAQKPSTNGNTRNRFRIISLVSTIAALVLISAFAMNYQSNSPDTNLAMTDLENAVEEAVGAEPSGPADSSEFGLVSDQELLEATELERVDDQGLRRVAPNRASRSRPMMEAQPSAAQNFSFAPPLPARAAAAPPAMPSKAKSISAESDSAEILSKQMMADTVVASTPGPTNFTYLNLTIPTAKPAEYDAVLDVKAGTDQLATAIQDWETKATLLSAVATHQDQTQNQFVLTGTREQIENQLAMISDANRSQNTLLLKAALGEQQFADLAANLGVSQRRMERPAIEQGKSKEEPKAKLYYQAPTLEDLGSPRELEQAQLRGVETDQFELQRRSATADDVTQFGVAEELDDRLDREVGPTKSLDRATVTDGLDSVPAKEIEEPRQLRVLIRITPKEPVITLPPVATEAADQ